MDIKYYINIEIVINMKTEEDYILQRISSTIKNKDPQAEVILFGSRARGNASIDSDWDILILLNTPHVSRKTEQEYRHSLIQINNNL